MHLSQLLSGVCSQVLGQADLYINDLCCDSRKVEQGNMFICIKGYSQNGHEYAREAVARGAVALLVEQYLEGVDATQIVVSSTRKTMPILAKNLTECACDGLKIISVVGTNGKTSTTYLLQSIFQEAGFCTGVIGSNGVVINNKRYDNTLTTPDPIELHKVLRAMLENRVKYVMMEATAHAIALNKLEGIRSETTVFTNLSQDHLDFFPSMKEYAEVKKSFFTSKYTKTAVVNVDDVLGREIMRDCRLPLLTYGIENPSDVFAIDYSESTQGISYTVNLYDEIQRVTYPLHGKFNLYNTLAASSAARLFGIKLDVVERGLLKVDRIAGRNETFYRHDGLKAVVDFAHTPDGMENVLSYLKECCQGKLIVVFGCGGQRDALKRPLMGAVASKYADYIVLTEDNSRNEDAEKILCDIQCGVTQDFTVIPSRKEAIAHALQLGGKKDTVAILGKGAESYLLSNNETIEYSDLDYVKRCLQL